MYPEKKNLASGEEKKLTSKHLDDQPAITADTRPILQKLSLSTFYIRYYVLRLVVDPLDHLALLSDHLRKLTEDPTKFGNRFLDRFDRLRTRGDVRVR